MICVAILTLPPTAAAVAFSAPVARVLVPPMVPVGPQGRQGETPLGIIYARHLITI